MNARKKFSLLELAQRFSSEDKARRWFEGLIWPDGERDCPNCGSLDTHECSHPKMPYRCRDCRKYFSVKTGTVMAGSPLSLRKWAFAIYLDATSVKGLSSMRLAEYIGVTQKTAWFMQQRIREAFADQRPELFHGTVEIDETYVGGKLSAMHGRKRRMLRKLGLAGVGGMGKAIVAGVKHRETNEITVEVLHHNDKEAMQAFVNRHAHEDATIYTDGASAYIGDRVKHETVAHTRGEYVRGDVHTNGIESFWATIKRAHKGTFHWWSKKHLHRYVKELAGYHNIRGLSTMGRMGYIVTQLVGKRLTWRQLVEGG